MKSLIKDQNQFNNFVNNILPPLIDGEELYFISLSFRNKYLAGIPIEGTGLLTEREYYGLGRTEMTGRTLGYGDWEYTMAKLASNLTYRKTKTGLPYPEKAMVVYVNINPSNIMKASISLAKNIMNVTGEMIDAYSNGKQPNKKQLIKVDRLLMNYIQKSTGTRHFIDIDVDAGLEYAQTLAVSLMEYDVEHYVIKTHGGYHVLIRRESLNKVQKELKLHEVINRLHLRANQNGGEVLFNKNNMLPMPGTLQAGKLVEVVELY